MPVFIFNFESYLPDMIYTKINLFLTAALAIILYFTVPLNNTWLYEKAIDHFSFLQQAKVLDIEDRRAFRFGNTYVMYKDMVSKIRKPEEAIILFPPAEYLDRVHEVEFTIPEPAVFYYTGVRSVWANSPDARRANYEVQINGPGKIAIRWISHQRHLDSLISVYKPMLH